MKFFAMASRVLITFLALANVLPACGFISMLHTHCPTSYSKVHNLRIPKCETPKSMRLGHVSFITTSMKSSITTKVLPKKEEEVKLSLTPVTLLSGFLGTGKTSALKNILENKAGLKVGVVVNDVAEVNIDARLIRGMGAISKSTAAVELQNGCACCSASEELLLSVEDLVSLGRSR